MLEFMRHKAGVDVPTFQPEPDPDTQTPIVQIWLLERCNTATLQHWNAGSLERRQNVGDSPRQWPGGWSKPLKSYPLDTTRLNGAEAWNVRTQTAHRDCSQPKGTMKRCVLGAVLLRTAPIVVHPGIGSIESIAQLSPSERNFLFPHRDTHDSYIYQQLAYPTLPYPRLYQPSEAYQKLKVLFFSIHKHHTETQHTTIRAQPIFSTRRIAADRSRPTSVTRQLGCPSSNQPMPSKRAWHIGTRMQRSFEKLARRAGRDLPSDRSLLHRGGPQVEA
jgi:hypothetical protein